MLALLCVRGHLDEGRRWLDMVLWRTELRHTRPCEGARGGWRCCAAARRLRVGKVLWQEGLTSARLATTRASLAHSVISRALHDLEGEADRATPLYEESASSPQARARSARNGRPILGVCLMSQGTAGRGREAVRGSSRALPRVRTRGALVICCSTSVGYRCSRKRTRSRRVVRARARGCSRARLQGDDRVLPQGIGEVLAARAGDKRRDYLGASDRLFSRARGPRRIEAEQATYAVPVEQLKDALGDDAYSSAQPEGRPCRLTRRSPSRRATLQSGGPTRW